MKLGLVGLGKIAFDQHLPSIAETGLFDLIGIVSRRGLTVTGAQTFPTQVAMFAALPELNAVANCTPPAVRYAAALDALQSGKHVLIEKPPTASVAALADLGLASTNAGRTLFATWHSQFNGSVGRVATILQQRPPAAVSIVWKEDVRRWHPGQDWIWQAGGFGVFDPGINALSILVKIMQEPVFVTLSEMLFPANRETSIAASLRLRSKGLSALSAKFDWRQEEDQTWTLSIKLHDGKSVVLTHGGTKLFVDETDLPTEADQGYRHIYRRFHKLMDIGQSDIDARPLHIVADAMLLGTCRETAAFNW